MTRTDGAESRVVHYAWIILAVCFINLFVSYGIRLGYSVVLPEMIRTMGLTRRQGADIFNAYLFAYICLSPFTGYLSDRLGARKVIAVFGVLLGAGTLLMGTSNGFYQAGIFFALVGIGAASMWTPIVALVQRWFSLKRRGMALGILSAGFGLGFAVMGKLFPVIVSYWDWRYCWFILGIAALVMVAVNIFTLRSKPEDMNLLPWGTLPEAESVQQGPALPGKPKLSSSELINTSRFWFIGFSYFLIAGTLYIITTFMVDYARYELGYPYAKASLLATIHGFGQVVGVLIILTVSDYIGRRMAIILSNICIALSTASIILAGSSELRLFASVGVFGAFFGATFPMYVACGGDYFRKEVMGTVIGLFTLFYGIGAIIANRMAGYMKDVTGSFTMPFVISVISAVAAALLMIFVKKGPSH